MAELGRMAVLLGGVFAAVHVAAVVAPAQARALLKAFPRNKPAGWVLAAVDMAWVYYLLTQTPLGRFEAYRVILYLLVPVTFVLVAVFMDELLAPRALGGLMILIPAPLLSMAKWHASAWRYVIIVLAYGMAIKGIALLLSPYLFRKVEERFLSTDRQCRAWGVVGLVLGALLVLLGFAVY